VESQTQRVEKWRTETVAPAEGTHPRLQWLRFDVIFTVHPALKKSPWGVGTTMDFIRLEILKYGALKSYEPWRSLPSADSSRKSWIRGHS
jgi:hypothetical protein